MRFTHPFVTTFAGLVEHVRGINRRYAKPRLAMSPAVKFALLSLRLYLLTLVGLLAYKFISVVIQ
jgi:hypothetical protein